MQEDLHDFLICVEDARAISKGKMMLINTWQSYWGNFFFHRCQFFLRYHPLIVIINIWKLFIPERKRQQFQQFFFVFFSLVLS